MTKLSRDFLQALEECCHESVKQALVGGVFVSFASKMKAVYGAYCRNHDSASTLYEKVKEIIA